MRFFLAPFFVAIGAVASDSSFVSHNDAGVIFAGAFDKLNDLYSSEKPETRENIMIDSSNILESFCDEGDLECIEYVRKTAHDRFNDSEGESEGMTYSDKFEGKLIASIQDMESVLDSMELDNVDEIMKGLSTIGEDIENMEGVSEEHKNVALMGLSIAKESVKLWHTTYNDPSHALYGLHFAEHYFDKEHQNRKLQDEDISISTIVMSDFEAGINRAMDMMSSGITNNYSVVRSVAVQAVLSSVSKREKCYYWGWFYW